MLERVWLQICVAALSNLEKLTETNQIALFLTALLKVPGWDGVKELMARPIKVTLLSTRLC